MSWGGIPVSSSKSGIIYWYKYNKLECDEAFIVESVRTFGEAFREHLMTLLPNDGHQSTTGHITTLDNSRIVSREKQNLVRAIKESISIRVKNPTLYSSSVTY